LGERFKDLTDIARLVEAHPQLTEMLPDELKKQVQGEFELLSY
jgi:hypothetical protein